jgi:hypothetical protein
MVLPSISKVQSKWMNDIREYFDNYEFEAAFRS